MFTSLIRLFTYKITSRIYNTWKSTSAVCGMTAPVKLYEGLLADHIRLAVEHLRSGCLISLPTDTLYGLACLAQNSEAIAEIYRVKQRNQAKPLAVCVAEVSDIYKWAHVTVPIQLLQDLLPGPVTLLFKRTLTLNPELNPGTELIGIRIPDSHFIKSVTVLSGGPLALTSANISNQQSPLTVQEFKSIWSEIACTFDGGRISSSLLNKNSQSQDIHSFASNGFNIHGLTRVSHKCDTRPCNIREGSTIINLSEKGSYKIYRQGIALSNTLNILHNYGLEPTL